MRKFWTLAAVSAVTIGGNGMAAQQAIPVAPAAQPATSGRSAALAAFFDDFDRAELAIQPTQKTIRGIRDGDYGEWGPQTDEAEIARNRLIIDTGTELTKRFDGANLSPQDVLSVRLFQSRARRAKAYLPFLTTGYSFHQFRSWQSELPAFIVASHSIANEAEAEAYIERIAGLGRVAEEKTEQARARATAGIIPPRWVFPLVLAEVDGLIASGTGPTLIGNPLIDDLRTKVGKLNVPDAQKGELADRAIAAWVQSAAPALARFRAEVARQQALARDEDGVWKLPNGRAYYDMLLGFHTTTNLNADQVHAIGLKETARLHREMREIMRKVGHKGSLQQFFEYTRTDPRFVHHSREAYLADARGKIDAMERALPLWFGALPKDRLQVSPVEAFREKNATIAFYNPPAPDGSRPGTYYINLYDLNALSKNEVEALAYHEGIPGHHLQRSIQFALGDLPAFRRFGGVTAYSEGWGLYAEHLGKDMGFYTDPYSDFGRLAMDILRSGRLVVDTGIHAKKWSRSRAIDWFMANTPLTRGDIVNQVERYVVNPGQATAYTIGKLKILELRERARTKLGKRFDIRAFHDVVLTSGPVPLDLLEERVNAWIASQKA